MKHLKKLLRNQKIALSKMGLDSKNYLRLTHDHESFTVVDIRTNKVLSPIRY